MQYKCQECNDTGGRDKIGAYFDCNACDTAATRRDLNDFVKSLTQRSTYPTHPEDVALAIHQRALAMAPKAIKPLKGSPWPDHDGGAQLRWVAPDGEVHGLPSVTDMLLYAEECFKADTADGYHGYPKDVRMGMIPELRKLFVQTAAPAAANGALTDERAAFEADTLDLYPSAKFNRFPSGTYTDSSIETQWGAWQRRSKFAAAGPDAALVKALESALAIINNEADPDEYAAPLKAIRAALSGAKGN